MAGNECLEAADILRAHVHEAIKAGPIDRKTWRTAEKDIQKALVTDSRSMYDFLRKRGSTPSEKRLRLDLEMIRDEMDDEGLIIKWVMSNQQLADALTKGSDEASLYLKLALETVSFNLTEDVRSPSASWILRCSRSFRVSRAIVNDINRRRTSRNRRDRIGNCLSRQPRGACRSTRRVCRMSR